MTRGIGETTAALRASIGHVRKGVDVLYVLPSFAMLGYVVDLAASIDVPDRRKDWARLEYGSACLRFASAANNPDYYEGWCGRVVFDHAAFWRIPARDRYRWHQFSHGCKVRFGDRHD